MRETFTFEAVDEEEKDRIRAHLHRRSSPLRKLLQQLEAEEDGHLHWVVRGARDGGETWAARAVLSWRSGRLEKEGAAATPESAVEEAESELVEVLREERLARRRETMRQRKSRRREELESVMALLSKDVQRNRRDSFLALLAPHLEFLGEQAGREITVLEHEGRLPRNRLAIGDVIDETLLLAWERFDRRQQLVPMDAWLTQLLHEVLDRAVARARQRVEGPRPDEEPSGRPGADADQWWRSHLKGDGDPVIWEDLFADDRNVEPFQMLRSDEERREVLALLSGIPTRDRIAFTLHTMDGYDLEEISMIQERSVPEVERAVERVRKRLREGLRA
jgi:RNA polymerase sigma factor (sigma-70 family)